MSELQLTRLDLRDPDAAALRARDALFRRGAVPDPAVRDRARAILADVRDRGSIAVREAGARYGGGHQDGRLLLPRDELAAAADALGTRERDALEAAIGNVRRFAEAQRPAASVRTTIVAGVELERRWLPVARAGVYAPGGSAPYPSSLVMGTVPALVAGVGSIVAASPADHGGRVNPVLLGAAGLLGVDALLVAGGVQAVGALAFGLPDEGLEPVDLVVGPGNAWVTAAKVELVGEIGIDLPAGPSEGLVLADATADVATVAADLITQAEHGPDSPALLVTPDAALADAVEVEVRRRLAGALRREILERALADHGRIVLVPSVEAGIDFVNGYGPEHLSVEVADLEGAVAAIRNAGSIFVGRWSPESAGDYASGANHVLPTGGLARSCGPLAVEAFGKFNQVQRITREGLATLRPVIRTLAEAEGLLAHRDAVEVRFAGDARPGGSRVSPSPFSVSSPTDPASYSWEATDEGIAERFGVPLSQVLRFDLNTSPAPPPELATILADGVFETTALRVPARRLPATRGGGIRGVRRHRRRDRARSRRRRGARHVHQGVPPGRRIDRGLGADIPDVPDPRRAAGWARDRRPPARSGARVGDGRPGDARGGPPGDPGLGLQPEQPDRSP